MKNVNYTYENSFYFSIKWFQTILADSVFFIERMKYFRNIRKLSTVFSIIKEVRYLYLQKDKRHFLKHLKSYNLKSSSDSLFRFSL